MFKIFKLEKKNADWIVASLVDAAGDVHENVSINKVSKKGDIFPNFDNLAKDQKVEGRLWKSDSDKVYLFAPKGGAKAAYKASEHMDRAYDKNFDSVAEEAEYPVSAKLETILNKLTGIQIDIQILKENSLPKKKTQLEAYGGEPEF